MTSRVNIVIVGGGTGAQLARELSRKLDATKVSLTLIDARPYRVHLIAMARIIVTDEGHVENDAFGSYDNLFFDGNGQFVQGRATGVETEKGGRSGHVILEGGKHIAFDILVLAPGSKWMGAMQLPDDPTEATRIIKESRESFKLKNAKNVVIAGAGGVGLGALTSEERKHMNSLPPPFNFLCRDCWRNQGRLPSKPLNVSSTPASQLWISLECTYYSCA